MRYKKKIGSFSKPREPLKKKSLEIWKFKKLFSNFVQFIGTKFLLYSKKSKVTLFLNRYSIKEERISQL